MGEEGSSIAGDGAWGTPLTAPGLPAGQPPEWFALERPRVLEEVGRLYLEAGADLVTTDTFGGTSEPAHDATGSEDSPIPKELP